jgi:uncharacterized protein (DUF1778 family)
MKTTASKTINLRVSTTTRRLIDRAADELHESRSSFMLEASLARAENVLADRSRFLLSEQQMRKFEAALEAPLPNPDALARLLKRRTPWSR